MTQPSHLHARVTSTLERIDGIHSCHVSVEVDSAAVRPRSHRGSLRRDPARGAAADAVGHRQLALLSSPRPRSSAPSHRCSCEKVGPGFDAALAIGTCSAITSRPARGERAPRRRWSRRRPLIAAGCPFGSCDAHTGLPSSRSSPARSASPASPEPARVPPLRTHGARRAVGERRRPVLTGARSATSTALAGSPLTPHPPRGPRPRRVGSQLPRSPPASAQRRRPAAWRAGERCVSQASGCDSAPRATPPCRARPW
jgi:hypothetical protein